MERQRILYLDILRVLACSMVVLMHTPHPTAGVPGIVQVPIYFITAAGLVLFFMISGALLLPTRLNLSQFLKRRVCKIAGPWFFWTVFYMAVDLPDYGVSFVEIEKLFVYVSSPGRHVMWFMFALLGLYLITPILSRFVQNATSKEVRFYLILWIISLAIPWVSAFSTLRLGISSPLYYFTGYVGYYLLGFYLHSSQHKMARFAPLLIVIPLLARLIYALMGGQRSNELFWYLSIPVMLMSVAWFVSVKEFCEKIGDKLSAFIKKAITLISDCSFGIFLIHIFVMRRLLWNIDFIVHGCGWLGQILLTWTLTMVISFSITYAISFLPISEYIIGYHQNRV